eukprot:12345426-Ditylum_brightwellii.AAC.1
MEEETKKEQENPTTIQATIKVALLQRKKTRNLERKPAVGKGGKADLARNHKKARIQVRILCRHQ